ncbi:MAG TPA: hotdog fold thioesterase [Saprospiraceae bacterium]|nr:hotdog fold thioesterase [Saprospiraceae bacterium]MBP6539767.1 hotdog fold thioesterase [Saprospiraceae bacterium]HMT53336.1 hotdog fold thioesterase [Saprospiraceae bacterium]HMT70290.1 hotdog fold thioesterase [Saprospiraceae bacterium]
MIWKVKPDVEVINNFNKDTLVAHLGIEIVEVGSDFIKSKMPVDHRTRQPMGLLHGGASVVLSESVGSMASWLVTADQTKNIVGIEVNANHLKSAKSGFVFGITKPIRIGRTLHVWNTEIYDEDDNLLCVSRLTVMVSS